MAKEENFEKLKNIISFIKLVIFVLICIIGLVMFPFIFSIIATNLIKFEIIESIETLEEYLQIFKGFDILLIILYERKISVSDILEKIISNFDVFYKNGESELQLKHKVQTHENELPPDVRSREPLKDDVILSYYKS